MVEVVTNNRVARRGGRGVGDEVERGQADQEEVGGVTLGVAERDRQGGPLRRTGAGRHRAERAEQLLEAGEGDVAEPREARLQVRLVTQVVGVYSQVVLGEGVLDDRDAAHEARGPGEFTTPDQALGKAGLQRGEPEVPQAGAAGGERRGLVRALVGDRRLAEHQFPDASRVLGGVDVGDHRADVMAHHAHVVGPADRDQERAQVGGHGLVVVAGGRGVALAGAGQVGRDDGVAFGERGHDGAPLVPGLRVAVDQEHGGAVAADHVVQADPRRAGPVLAEPGGQALPGRGGRLGGGGGRRRAEDEGNGGDRGRQA